MKKLSLLKLNEVRALQPEALKRIKGGSCRAWSCQCNLDSSQAQSIDDQLERNDRDGYIP